MGEEGYVISVERGLNELSEQVTVEQHWSCRFPGVLLAS